MIVYSKDLFNDLWKYELSDVSEFWYISNWSSDRNKWIVWREGSVRIPDINEYLDDNSEDQVSEEEIAWIQIN